MNGGGHPGNDVLLDFLEGKAGPGARAHVEGCARCRGELDALRPLSADLGRLGEAVRPAPDPAAVERILSRIDEPRKKRTGRLYTARRPAWPWVAAAAAAVAVVAVLALATRPQERPRPAVAEERPPLEKILDPVPAPSEPPRSVPPTPEVPRSLPPAAAPAPKPPEPVPAPPAPRPPEPEKPKPTPPEEPEKPRPAPAPAETRPARVALSLAKLEGSFEVQEDKAWKKLEKPGAWEAGAALRAVERPGRLTLGDGARVTLRARTELRVASADPPALLLEQGEVYCEVEPGAGRRFAVVTPDATVAVTGTRFGVKRTDHTEVAVTAGEVRVSNEKGEVSVPAGGGVSARRSVAPPKPRPVDADALVAWRRASDPPETTRFRYDFEDGRLPYPWTGGKVAAGPARGFNRHCLEGAPGASADLSRVDRRVPVYKSNLHVRFRYYAPAGTDLTFQLFTDRVQDNFRHDVKPLVLGKWETVEAPLSEFYRISDRASKLQDGDRFLYLNFAVWGTDGPVWFDDIEFVEIHK
jgi:hypothetical protein